MGRGPAGATTTRPGWAPARQGSGGAAGLRTVLGAVAILVVVLAALALLNSFFVELAPGQPDPQPGGGDQGNEDTPAGDDGGGGGGNDWDCDQYADLFFWFFVGLAAAAVALFAVAVVRREHHGGRIGSTVWGILSVVATFLAVLAYGVHRVIQVLCDGALDCAGANDGTYSSFLVLLVVTLVALGIGIALSHAQRRNFLGTGWGLLGMLLYLPAVLVGFTWFIIRTFCTPELSCALRDSFLSDLAWIFWLSLAGTVLAIGIGWLVRIRFAHGVFKSGWGVLAILLGLLAVLSGAGWLFVDSIQIPICDTLDPEEFEEFEDEEPPTCEETRDALRGRILTGMGITLAAAVLSIGAGLFLHRKALGGFWGSAWAIIGYIALGVLLLMGLLWLLAGSMCGEGEDGVGEGDQGFGDGDQGQGGGDQGGGDSGGGSSGGGGSGGGSTGGGGGGGGPDAGPGGGGGGTGEANPLHTPVPLDPKALTWVFVALLVIVGIVVFIMLLRFRRDKGLDGDAGPAAPGAETISASERAQLMALIERGRLASDEAVVAAYRAFCAWSASRGVQPQPQETPREHAARVAARYDIGQDMMARFLHAYEVARLSQRLPTDEERAAAIGFTKGLGAVADHKEGQP